MVGHPTRLCDVRFGHRALACTGVPMSRCAAASAGQQVLVACSGLAAGDQELVWMVGATDSHDAATCLRKHTSQQQETRQFTVWTQQLHSCLSNRHQQCTVQLIDQGLGQLTVLPQQVRLQQQQQHSLQLQRA